MRLLKRSHTILASACAVAAMFAVFAWHSSEAPAPLPRLEGPVPTARPAPEIERVAPPSVPTRRTVAPIVAVDEEATSRTGAPTLSGGGGSTFAIRARDAMTEAPLADIVVVFRAPGIEIESRTGPDGWTEVDWPDSRRAALVKLSSAGHAVRTVELVPPARATVDLRPLDTLTGFVLDRETSRPVANAEVRAGAMPAAAVTDASGRFSIESFPFERSGTFAQVTARGYGSQHVEFHADRDGYNVLEIAAAKRLLGTVSDYHSARPISGVRIRATGVSAETIEDGYFNVEVSQFLSVIEVTFSAEGYCEATVQLRPSLIGADIRLPRTAKLIGTVHDARGAPVVGASVGMQPDRVRLLDIKGAIRLSNQGNSQLPLPDGFRIRAPRAASEVALTDPDGRFTLAHLLPTATFGLQVEGEGLETRIFTIELGGPGSTTEVELFPGCPEEYDHLADLETRFWNR